MPSSDDLRSDDPGAADPGAADPGAADTGAADTGAVDPSAADPRAWILVVGSSVRLAEQERVAAARIGALLAREGYGLVAGTWGGVDEMVTRSFAKASRPELAPHRVVHVQNHPLHSRHDLRLGRIVPSSPSDAYSAEAVELAHAGVVVGGRTGSKPTMDALMAAGKPVIPFAWLGSDALECLKDQLREAMTFAEPRAHKRLLLQLLDPACGVDETVSRVLGGLTARHHDVFVSYHRIDSGPEAGRLAADLGEIYGRRRIFLDYTALPPASRLQALLDGASRARAVLALIGGSFTERVVDADDFVRRELEAAMGGSAVVLPVAMDRSRLDRSRLPASLMPLLDRNAVFLDSAHWDTALARIVTGLDAALAITRMRPNW